MSARMSRSVLRGCLAGIFMTKTILAYGDANMFWAFNSRPDLAAPVIEVSMNDTALVAPGYILIAPYTAPPNSNLAAGSTSLGSNITSEIEQLEMALAEAIPNGPYVYDQEGNLVYSGYGSTGASYSHDVKVVDYEGAPHLTFFQGNDGTGGNRGHGVIMDNSYHIVNTVSAGFGRAPTDVHEFTILPNGNAITTIFQPVQYDLSAFGVDQPFGWVIEGIFQEIDIATGEVVFEWRSLDYTDPADSYNTIGSTGAGNGTSMAEIWDYFHLNSVEKDAVGNYLISSRYFSALFYISGTDGSIIWQLNGKKNQFTFSGFNTLEFNNTLGFNNTFAFQHHARLHPSPSNSTNSTNTIISIFDNGSDGFIIPQNYSSGMIMSLDTTKKTCTLLNQYTLTLPGTSTNMSSTSQGNLQLLSNSNVFIGWGSQPFYSEFSHDGKLLMKAQFGANTDLAENYRAFKANWTGVPDSTPAIWSTANSTTSPTEFYVSFNGATEVASWRFFGGSSASDAGNVLGTAKKQGFETSFVANSFVAWGSVQALDSAGSILATSPVSKTYVPSNGGVSLSNVTNAGMGVLRRT